jgi:hypothetical protein
MSAERFLSLSRRAGSGEGENSEGREHSRLAAFVKDGEAVDFPLDKDG